ncbi:MAG: hypothetical protein P8P74_02340 [Crocinitomicaceae bacterium]|nr:hypothetical protein [Crocinitomicaceae bacterium]
MNQVKSTSLNHIEALSHWFKTSIEELDQFGEYDQLQLIICAFELGVKHPLISTKIEEIGKRAESDSMDRVFQYLEQILMMKYDEGESRQQIYFNYWIKDENYLLHNDLTKAYNLGYVLMKENKISSPELRLKAIKWIKDTEFLPSMSFTAWTAFYLENGGEHEAAKSRFEEIMELQMDNGSWNDYPMQTIQIAYPLSLTSFGNDPRMSSTKEYILNLPWEGYSGDIRYEVGLLKWLGSNGVISY